MAATSMPMVGNQGCASACSAERREEGSTRRRPETKSRASCETDSQTGEGKESAPALMASSMASTSPFEGLKGAEPERRV